MAHVAPVASERHNGGMEKKDVRVQLVISESEVAALDAWRAEHRIWSRSDAIRQLIASGIEKPPKPKPKG